MDGIRADLLPERVELELNLELLPGNVLSRDIRDLAGILDFTTDEIQYVCAHQTPFKFFLDQWCKREDSKATLEKLYEALIKLERPDLGELVQQTIQDLKKANFNQLQKLAKLQDERVKRRDEDCTFISKELCEEKRPPYVYAVYFPEDEEHLEQTKDLINNLRSLQIDAHASMLESQTHSSNRQYYVFSNLQKADYVLILCSPSVIYADKIMKLEDPGHISNKIKELMFSLTFIIGDIYKRKGVNSKYIPVCLSTYSSSDIPKFLRTPKSYKIPDDFDTLARRIFKVPEYELPKIQKKTFEPKVFK